MCGRFVLATRIEAISDQFMAQPTCEWSASYNIAPSQSVVTVCLGVGDERQLHRMRWGFIPHWAKQESYLDTQWINARSETAAKKPAFRQAMAHRRCVIIADGFYEWDKQSELKQPYYIQTLDSQPFAIAGIWERWVQSDGHSLISCAMLTTAATSPVSRIHARMPLLVGQAAISSWLDLAQHDAPKALAALTDTSSSVLSLYPVTPEMNNPRFNSSQCIQPYHKRDGSVD